MTLEWPKWLAMGSKRAHFTCLGTPNGVGSFLEKHTFDPFFTHFDPFFVAKQPIFNALCDFGGAKMACNGLKMGSFHLFRHPKWSRIIFGKTHFFDPFLTHFLPPNSPFSRHFGILGGPQRATMSSKRTRNTCLGIPCGPGSFLKKVIFLHPVDLVDPFWHPPLWVTSYSLLQPTGPRYGGLGVG